MIKAVLADWGHTLFDTAGSTDFIEQWAAERGHAVTRSDIESTYRRALDRSRTPEELAKGRDKRADLHRACWLGLYAELDALVPGVAEPLYAVETGAIGWSPYVDTPPFLEALHRRGIPLVVVSDVTFDLRPIFDHHGLRQLVHDFVLSGEHGSTKAEGDLFHLALSAAGVAPHEALMIGDNPANDGNAVHHGITTVLLPPVRSGEPRGLVRVLDIIP